jgi:hypothetical protein
VQGWTADDPTEESDADALKQSSASPAAAFIS